MAYQLYWGAGSPYSWRVLLAFEVMELKYESKLLEFSKAEHESDYMLAMNPRGRLPVLKNGDEVIYESIAILAYLDGNHQESALFGSTSYEKGRVWQRIFEIENYLNRNLIDIVLPVYRDKVADDIASIENAADKVHTELRILEDLFSASPYVVGERITAADIILYPDIASLRRAMSLEAAATLELNLNRLEENYPQITCWMKRIESIPGYDKTYPPNWRD